MHFSNHGSEALVYIKTHENPIYQPSSPASDTAFPILAIAVLSIMATAFLLVSYYIFVIKCCLSWHHIELLRRFSTSQSRQQEDPLMDYSPTFLNRGLDESLFHQIPTFLFRRGQSEEGSFHGCVVCLNEFQEHDMIRVLPNCSHAFHLDCIDIWLQSNANCPLCRSSISGTTREALMGGDDDFVVIELGGGDDRGVILPPRQQERADSRELLVQSRGPSPTKLQQKLENKKSRKFHYVSSMGDECIDVREKDDQFLIQPIRRSFSMDSAGRSPALYDSSGDHKE
ncbi:RING-H2 finger protein ATL1 [Vitis vinifera]|uniref:RING-type E3 ubiquitin transferase n=1 Tax=Vitis vinifera TaxID=29760 RepID=A0A438KDB3_VITVI|nr:RING-H2 finger protein ATL1 [Vitis vinifera]